MPSDLPSDLPPEPPRDSPPDTPPSPPPLEERPLPRGCHPLVFGIVMATIQFAATLYFMPPSCFGHSG